MHSFPQIWNLLLLESRNYICWRMMTSIFVIREVLQLGGGKVRRRNEQQQNAHLSQECKLFNLFDNSMYFFKISQTFKCRDLHCLRQRTVTLSEKGLAEGASPHHHAEISPVKVKDTHLMNDKLPPTEILCWDCPLICCLLYKRGHCLGFFMWAIYWNLQ